jgi:hypothetical protein
MANKVSALTVALEEGVSEEALECIINAIQQLRGVSGVCKKANDIQYFTAKMNVGNRIYKKIITVMDEELNERRKS